MYNKFILISLILFLIVSCGGGGGSTYSGSGPGQISSSLENLNPNNLCKKAWYTTTFQIQQLMAQFLTITLFFGKQLA